MGIYLAVYLEESQQPGGKIDSRALAILGTQAFEPWAYENRDIQKQEAKLSLG